MTQSEQINADKAEHRADASPASSAHAIEIERELSHRVKNMFAVINAIVSITGRVKGIPKEAAEINSRIQALGRAYETTFEESHIGSFDLNEAVAAVLRPYAAKPGRLTLKSDILRVPSATISLVGMVLHELAVNAKQHGAWSVEDGAVTVECLLGCIGLSCETSDMENGALTVVWREVGGPAPSADAIEPGGGTAIVDRLLATSRGSIERDWEPGGLVTRVCIPVAKNRVSDKRTILLLEDEGFVLVNLEMAAEDQGHDVLSALTASDALSLINEHAEPDVAVLDVNLGGGGNLRKRCARIAGARDTICALFGRS